MKNTLPLFRILSLVPFLTMTACATAGPSTRVHIPLPPAPPTGASTAISSAGLELTEDEQLLMGQLKRRVQHLSATIGERNVGKSWELAEAADYIALELEGMGFPLERQGYETEEVAAQNLGVTIQGGTQGDEVLIVGVHYDTRPTSAGWNEGATGTAALLELARLMRDARLTRTLRLVFFAMGEAPHGQNEARGARQYAQKFGIELKGKPRPGLPDAVNDASEMSSMGIVLLDRLGSFEMKSPHVAKKEGPFSLMLCPSPGANRLHTAFRQALAGSELRVEELAYDPATDSDAAAFLEQGLPSLVVSGNRQELAGDSAVQYEALTRTVMRLRYGIGEILGELPTNDAMLTPYADKFR